MPEKTHEILKFANLPWMYKMSDFSEPDHEAVIRFMQAHPFVTLISHDGQQSAATQIPVLIDIKENEIILRGHVMRKTDHHKAMEKDANLLLLFTGPHCYVSSSWYTEKMGATWNYQTVHVRGITKMLDDHATINLLKDLTAKFEAGQEQPLLLTDMPTGYAENLVKAIAGFEIKVTDIYPIFKLSQNRDDDSYANIIKHLLASDDTDAHKIAVEMKKRRPDII